MPRSIVLVGIVDEETAHAVVRRLFDDAEPPTAIFAAQNRVLTGTVRAMHELGVQRTVALVGFDDVELLDVVDPGVTVVAQDPHRLGELAAERLLTPMFLMGLFENPYVDPEVATATRATGCVSRRRRSRVPTPTLPS